MPALVDPEQRIKILFEQFDKKPGVVFPSHGTLAKQLSELLAKQDKALGSDLYTTPSHIPPSLSALFVSAAVEMWLRSVHSFLISASVTETSDIWASVSGYYSSHYSVRAFAHLLGFFLMHQDKHIAALEISGGKHYCNFSQSKKLNREHHFYWKTVTEHPLFKDDPLFLLNLDKSDVSDVAHRNVANYFDHINDFQMFQVLNEEQVTERIDFLAKVQLSTVPIPRWKKYPDLESVQLIAYHRIVRFRSYLDNLLGSSSNSWKIQRNPSWCPRVINYQIVPLNLKPAAPVAA